MSMDRRNNQNQTYINDIIINDFNFILYTHIPSYLYLHAAYLYINEKKKKIKKNDEVCVCVCVLECVCAQVCVNACWGEN